MKLSSFICLLFLVPGQCLQSITSDRGVTTSEKQTESSYSQTADPRYSDDGFESKIMYFVYSCSCLLIFIVVKGCLFDVFYLFSFVIWSTRRRPQLEPHKYEEVKTNESRNDHFYSEV